MAGARSGQGRCADQIRRRVEDPAFPAKAGLGVGCHHARWSGEAGFQTAVGVEVKCPIPGSCDLPSILDRVGMTGVVGEAWPDFGMNNSGQMHIPPGLERP